ncbi:unnamed protein product, partial [Mesorhabditis spiculigera]
MKKRTIFLIFPILCSLSNGLSYKCQNNQVLVVQSHCIYEQNQDNCGGVENFVAKVEQLGVDQPVAHTCCRLSEPIATHLENDCFIYELPDGTTTAAGSEEEKLEEKSQKSNLTVVRSLDELSKEFTGDAKNQDAGSKTFQFHFYSLTEKSPPVLLVKAIQRYRESQTDLKLPKLDRERATNPLDKSFNVNAVATNHIEIKANEKSGPANSTDAESSGKSASEAWSDGGKGTVEEDGTGTQADGSTTKPLKPEKPEKRNDRHPPFPPIDGDTPSKNSEASQAKIPRTPNSVAKFDEPEVEAKPAKANIDELSRENLEKSSAASAESGNQVPPERLEVPRNSSEASEESENEVSSVEVKTEASEEKLGYRDSAEPDDTGDSESIPEAEGLSEEDDVKTDDADSEVKIASPVPPEASEEGEGAGGAGEAASDENSEAGGDSEDVEDDETDPEKSEKLRPADSYEDLGSKEKDYGIDDGTEDEGEKVPGDPEEDPDTVESRHQNSTKADKMDSGEDFSVENAFDDKGRPSLALLEGDLDGANDPPEALDYGEDASHHVANAAPIQKEAVRPVQLPDVPPDPEAIANRNYVREDARFDANTRIIDAQEAQAEADEKAAVAQRARRNCFSGDLLVPTPYGNRRMDELQIGDRILVPIAPGVSQFEMIEMFYHRDPEKETMFLKIKTRERSISVTPKHLIPAGNCGDLNETLTTEGDVQKLLRSSIFARNLKPGMCLVTVLVVQSFGNDTIRMHCQRLDLCGYQRLKCEYDTMQPHCGGRMNFVSHVNQGTPSGLVEHTCCQLYNPRPPNVVPTHEGNDCFIYELPDGSTHPVDENIEPISQFNAEDQPLTVLKSAADIPSQIDGYTGYRLRLFLLRNKSPPTLLVKGIERRIDGYRVTICRPRCSGMKVSDQQNGFSGVSWSRWSSSSWSSWARSVWGNAEGEAEAEARERESGAEKPSTPETGKDKKSVETTEGTAFKVEPDGTSSSENGGDSEGKRPKFVAGREGPADSGEGGGNAEGDDEKKEVEGRVKGDDFSAEVTNGGDEDDDEEGPEITEDGGDNVETNGVDGKGGDGDDTEGDDDASMNPDNDGDTEGANGQPGNAVKDGIEAKDEEAEKKRKRLAKAKAKAKAKKAAAKKRRQRQKQLRTIQAVDEADEPSPIQGRAAAETPAAAGARAPVQAAAPAADAVAADAPGAGAGGAGKNCFAADSVVSTPEGLKRMDELQVGDRVLVPTANGVPKYELVEMFYHRVPDRKTNFVLIETENGRKLAVTPLHLLPVGSCDDMRQLMNNSDAIDQALRGSRFAYRAQVGDCVLAADDEGQVDVERIVKVGRRISTGIYSPITVEGSIIVDGVLASCFAQVESHATHKILYDFTHWAYRMTGLATSTEQWSDVLPLPKMIHYMHELSRHVLPFVKF